MAGALVQWRRVVLWDPISIEGKVFQIGCAGLALHLENGNDATSQLAG